MPSVTAPAPIKPASEATTPAQSATSEVTEGRDSDKAPKLKLMRKDPTAEPEATSKSQNIHHEVSKTGAYIKSITPEP